MRVLYKMGDLVKINWSDPDVKKLAFAYQTFHEKNYLLGKPFTTDFVYEVVMAAGSTIVLKGFDLKYSFMSEHFTPASLSLNTGELL